jgi:pimeloyl-ACP methyl ester carboxylesterase
MLYSSAMINGKEGSNFLRHTFTETKDPYNFGGKVLGFTASPQNPKTDVETFFVHGYGQDHRVEDYLRLFAAKDRKAIGLAYPGNRSSSLVWEAYPTEEGKVRMPRLQVSKAKAMVDFMDQKDIEKADLVATSEGALRTMIFATLYPDRRRNIVLVCPGGMGGVRFWTEQNARVVYQAGKDAAHRLLQEQEEDKARSGVNMGGPHLLFRHPLRAVAESASAAYTRFDRLLPELAKAENPPLITVITNKGDVLFPEKGLRRRIDESSLFKFSVLDVGGHGIGRTPIGINAIDQDLTEMEQANKERTR